MKCEGITNGEKCFSYKATKRIVLGKIAKTECYLCDICATETKKEGYKVVEIIDEDRITSS